MPEFLDKHIDNLIRILVEYAPKVIMAVVVLLVGLWLIKRIAKLADKAMVRRDLEISLRTFLKSLISIGLKIILIVTVAGMMGIGTASFVTILGAAGLAVGLALQGSLSNFAGGVLILIFKPFKVGDVVEAQGQTGEVKEIQIFNTILLTVDHKTVILPNGPLSNGTIVNITRYGSIRLDVAVTVSIDNDIKKVKQIISNVLISNSKVLQNPQAGIFIGSVIDGAVPINIKPYCAPENSPSLTSELYHDLKEAFEAAKIKQPMPKRRVVNVKDGSDD
ncbi:MAG: mechanosensitive ion channel [Bacteroidota bacterium]|nr:mechanosensitive ion channel [Bacteroidota bacterium]